MWEGDLETKKTENDWFRELYTVRQFGDSVFRVDKFDGWFNWLGSNGIFRQEFKWRGSRCTCRMGQRSDCRHRIIIRFFIESNRLDTGYFLDWNTKEWELPLNHPVRRFQRAMAERREKP